MLKVDNQSIKLKYNSYSTVKRLLAHTLSPTIPNHIKQFRKPHSDDALNEERDCLNSTKENKKLQEIKQAINTDKPYL